MSALVFALAASTLRAQDHIFAEPTLGVLREAIAARRVSLANATLRSEILRNKLAALLVPPGNEMPGEVRKCYKGTTRFVSESVTAADMDGLRAFAEDRLPLLLINLFAPENRGRTDELLEELKSEVEKSAPEERKNAEVFLGSLLSELRYDSPIRDRLVGVYREARAEEVQRLIDQGYESVVIGGRPPVFANSAYPQAPLALDSGTSLYQQLIRLQNVGSELEGTEIGGLNAVWKGRTIILNPPTLEHARDDGAAVGFLFNKKDFDFDGLRSTLPLRNPGSGGDDGPTP